MAARWLGVTWLALAGAAGCGDCGAGIFVQEADAGVSDARPGGDAGTLDTALPPADAAVQDLTTPDIAAQPDTAQQDRATVDRAQQDQAQPPSDAGVQDRPAPDGELLTDTGVADQTAADQAIVDLAAGADAVHPDGALGDATLPDVGQPDRAPLDSAQPDSGSVDAGPCPALSDRLNVVELSTGADDGVAYNTQVFTAPRPGGGTVIGWSSNRNVGYISDPKVHLTWTDAAGVVSQAETLIEASYAELGGLAAAPDGYALLLYSRNAEDQDVFSFVRVDDDGQVGLSVDIAGDCDPAGQELSLAPDSCIWPRNWWHMGGIGHLLWTGARFAAYFAFVTTSAGASEWGEADTFRYYDASGELVEIGATMGCTHSMGRSLAWNGTQLAPVCLQDLGGNPVLASMGETIPYGGGTWAVHADIEDVANVATTLGEVVPASDGFWVAWTSVEERTNNDVRLAHFTNDGEVLSKTWLTDTPALSEQYAHLAPFEGGLIAAWQTVEDGQAYLARVDASGQVQGAAEPVAVPVGYGLAATAPFDGRLPTPLRGLLTQLTVFPNGDVVWAVPTEETAYRTHTEITLVRLPSCR